MPAGARKGEARLLGSKRVPPSLHRKLKSVPLGVVPPSTRFESQQADEASRVRAHGRIRQSAAVQASIERRHMSLDEYAIEPVGDTYPLAEKAQQYAKDVLKDKIPACKWVKAAAKRFMLMQRRDDMVFNPYEAERACNFIQSMPHVKGRWATRTIQLEGWQCMVICAIFGFYWIKDLTSRVVRLSYIEVPRKNAKSTLAAAIGLYMLAEDGEEGAEVYSAATTHKQSLAIFDTAKAMARRHQAFAEAHDIVVQSHEIKVWGTLGKFEALHAQGETLDGLNASCNLIDELHAHKTRAVYDVLETAMGARRNPLMFIITTAGVNRAGICYEVRSYALKVLDEVLQDWTLFAVVYTIDEKDAEKKDYWNPKVWAKANPNFNISVYEQELARLASKARVSNSALNNFLTKHLNVWVNASTAWMDMMRLEKCADSKLDIEDFKGEECVIGLDLASKIDINAKARMFRRVINAQDHYYAFLEYYLPEARVNESDENDQYSGWAQAGWLTTTPGEVIDMDQIEEDIIADASLFKVKEVGFDPFQATQMVGHLAEDGFTMVEVRPTVLMYSEPMKFLQELVYSGRFHYDGDPILTWMISNVMVKMDRKDNIFPQKEFPENKIDGVIAVISALNRWIADKPNESVYDERGLVVL